MVTQDTSSTRACWSMKLSKTFLRVVFFPVFEDQPGSKYEGLVGAAMLTLVVLEYFLCLLNE